MTDNKEKTIRANAGKGCDIRVWDDSCRRSEYKSEGDKYLCAACGKIPLLHHEVHHEHFPHMCGDEDDMS